MNTQEIKEKYIEMLGMFQYAIKEMRRRKMPYLPVKVMVLSDLELSNMKPLFGSMCCETHNLYPGALCQEKTLFISPGQKDLIRKKKNFWMQCLAPEGIFKWNVHNVLCEYEKEEKKYVIQSYKSGLPHIEDLFSAYGEVELVRILEALDISQLIKEIAQRIEEFAEFELQISA